MTLINIENVAATALCLWLLMAVIKAVPQQYRHSFIDALFGLGIITWAASIMLWAMRVWG